MQQQQEVKLKLQELQLNLLQAKKNPYHALINDIPEDKAEELFANKEKNPISKEKRYNNK